MKTYLTRFGIVMGAALVLAACGGGTSALEQAQSAIPDMQEQGYEAIDCAEATVFGPQWDPQDDQVHGADCWVGTPGTPFYAEADFLASSIRAQEGATDITAQACPEDVLNEAGGIACRAFAFGEEGDRALLRAVVVVRDIDGVMSRIGEEPTEADVYDALFDAEVEVLLGTESLE